VESGERGEGGLKMILSFFFVAVAMEGLDLLTGGSSKQNQGMD